MRVFAPYLKDASHVRLKYGIKRLDGTYVWGTITEDDWARVVKGDREEIGVFLPNHDSAPYDPREVCLALLLVKGGVHSSLDVNYGVHVARRKSDIP